MDELCTKRFNDICRVCLRARDGLNFMYSLKFFDVPEKIAKCADVKVFENDGFPSNICGECLSELNSCYKFRTLCEESDRILREVVQRENIKEERESSASPMPLLDIVLKEEPGNIVLNDDESAPVEIKKKVIVRRLRNSVKTSKICQNCFSRFRTLQELKHHREYCAVTPEEQEGLGLDVVNKKRTYTRRKPLRIHRCEPCNKVFAARKCWVNHIVSKHGAPTPAKPQTECKVCQTTFKCWSDLLVHEKTYGHYPKEICPFCNKSFCRSYISLHLREHSSEEPLLCNGCGRTYTNEASFKNHVKCCTNAEKTFKCPQCDKRFHTRGRLSQHGRMHSNEKPHVCETCGASFRMRTHLRNHVMVHVDARPHSCKVCKKRFRTTTVLNEHMRIHTGVRPYVCDVCDAAFTQKHCLKTHRLKHENGAGETAAVNG